MKFVQKHLNTHHFFRKPHKWFLAFLGSPIHAAEMHYKKKYHLTFVHARKLFLFDMMLLASTVLLLFATAFWFLYDPTITDYITVRLEPTAYEGDEHPERIRSGEDITYTFYYENGSDIAIHDAKALFRLPKQFILTTTSEEALEDDAYAFAVGELQPGDTGDVSINGIFYGTPDQEYLVGASLQYKQADESFFEQAATHIITTLRESVLEGSITSIPKILEQQTVDLSFEITNTYKHDLNAIEIPLNTDPSFTFQSGEPTLGAIENDVWSIDVLKENQTATLSATYFASIQTNEPTAALTLTPQINVQGAVVPQAQTAHTYAIARPHMTASASWQKQTSPPGETVPFTITVTNDGDVDLVDGRIEIPLPATFVNQTAAVAQNGGILSAGTLTLNATQYPKLASLPIGQTQTFVAAIPLAYVGHGGTDVKATLSPIISARVPEIETQRIQTTATSDELNIGTQILLEAEVLYFTPEGDQLGRGPLPPKVGKKTTYGSIVKITNTTSDAKNVVFTATVPTWVAWVPERASVSHGTALSYNPNTRVVSWSTGLLKAHQTATLFFGLALTPDSGQVGLAPGLLKDISVSATDGYIGGHIAQTHSLLDASLLDDVIAQQKGTNVVD